MRIDQDIKEQLSFLVNNFNASAFLPKLAFINKASNNKLLDRMKF